MKRRIAVLGAAALLSAVGAPAHATAGHFDDPQGDWTSGSGPLDVKRVTHDNDLSTITYTVESYTDFNLDKATFKWSLDCTPTDNRGADAYVSVRFLGGQGVVGELYHSGANDKKGAPAVSKAGPVLTVKYPRAMLPGVCSSSYHYDVYASSSEGMSHADPVPKYPNPKPVHDLGYVPPPPPTAAPTTAATLPPTTATTLPATTTTIEGDLNGDGVVNDLDAQLAQSTSASGSDDDRSSGGAIGIGAAALVAAGLVAFFVWKRRASAER